MQAFVVALCLINGLSERHVVWVSPVIDQPETIHHAGKLRLWPMESQRETRGVEITGLTKLVEIFFLLCLD